jgi:hypothetical protein
VRRARPPGWNAVLLSLRQTQGADAATLALHRLRLPVVAPYQHRLMSPVPPPHPLPRDIAQAILERSGVPAGSGYQLGVSKVFLRAGHMAVMDKLRTGNEPARAKVVGCLSFLRVCVVCRPCPASAPPAALRLGALTRRPSTPSPPQSA